MLHPASDGLMDHFHLVGNLGLILPLLEHANGLGSGVSLRHRNRVVKGFPGSTQEKGEEKEKGPNGLSGPLSL
jgi:hypothetical protein